jgi:hypothetical protein
MKYRDFAYNDKVAKLDGFKDSAEMRKWFEEHYRPKPDDLFDIIQW